MTWANRITMLRILMIPIFVTLMIYYGESVKLGHPVEWMRVLAFGVFVAAAVSDAIDGYLARHFNQRSVLGTFLDPIADKTLLVSAIVLLSVNHGDAFTTLPVWFAVTVIGRDVLLALGAVVIQMVVGKVTVRPRIIGKISTVCQMLLLGWTILFIPQEAPTVDRVRTVLLASAEITTIISWLWYFYDGAKQLGHAEGKIGEK